MAGAPFEPWDVSENAFPEGADPGSQLRFLVSYAILAPSVHNTQPWLFTIRNDVVELSADRSRALAVGDPCYRELIISCGAALFHLRVAARHFGYREILETFPDPQTPDLLARLRLGPRGPANGEDRILFEAITHRHTSRMDFDFRSLPDSLRAALSAAAAEEGAWLAPVEGVRSRRAVAGLVAEGARRQLADLRYRGELADWLRPNWGRRGDGLPGYALGAGLVASFLAPALVRNFDFGDEQADRDERLAAEAPTLAVLGTDEDSPASWLAAGQALARVLLRACAEGVGASFFNQAVELADLRPQLGKAVRRRGFPQLLLRLGYGPGVRPTPRRKADEVLVKHRGRPADVRI